MKQKSKCWISTFLHSSKGETDTFGLILVIWVVIVVFGALCPSWNHLKLATKIVSVCAITIVCLIGIVSDLWAR